MGGRKGHEADPRTGDGEGASPSSGVRARVEPRARILLVDEDPTERAFRAKCLAAVLPIDVATSPAHARDLAARARFVRGIVVSTNLSGICPLDLVDALRADLAQDDCPALLVGPLDDPAIAARAAAWRARFFEVDLELPRVRRELRRFAHLVRFAPHIEQVLRDYVATHALSPARESLIRSSLLLPRTHLSAAHQRSESATRDHISKINERCGTEDLRDVLEDLLLEALSRAQAPTDDERQKNDRGGI